jgi:hypothetical protein
MRKGAEHLWNHFGAKVVYALAFEDTDGTVRTIVQDFNEEFGGGASFVHQNDEFLQESGFYTALAQFAKRDWPQVEQGNDNIQRPVRQGALPLPMLPNNENGEPTLPDPKACPTSKYVAWLKTICRAFFAQHYGKNDPLHRGSMCLPFWLEGLASGKGERSSPPWGDLREHPRKYISPEVLDDEHTQLIQDPSKMSKENLLKLLQHLFDRQSGGHLPPFTMIPQGKGGAERQSQPAPKPKGKALPSPRPPVHPNNGQPIPVPNNFHPIPIADSDPRPRPKAKGRGKAVESLPSPDPTPGPSRAQTPDSRTVCTHETTLSPIHEAQPVQELNSSITTVPSSKVDGAKHDSSPISVKNLTVLSNTGFSPEIDQTKPTTISGTTREVSEVAPGLWVSSLVRKPLLPASQRVQVQFKPQQLGRTLSSLKEAVATSEPQVVSTQAKEKKVDLGAKKGRKGGKGGTGRKARKAKDSEETIHVTTIDDKVALDDDWYEEDIRPAQTPVKTSRAQAIRAAQPGLAKDRLRRTATPLKRKY